MDNVVWEVYIKGKVITVLTRFTWSTSKCLLPHNNYKENSHFILFTWAIQMMLSLLEKGSVHQNHVTILM